VVEEKGVDEEEYYRSLVFEGVRQAKDASCSAGKVGQSILIHMGMFAFICLILLLFIMFKQSPQIISFNYGAGSNL